jgi:hypothetical protein
MHREIERDLGPARAPRSEAGTQAASGSIADDNAAEELPVPSDDAELARPERSRAPGQARDIARGEPAEQKSRTTATSTNLTRESSSTSNRAAPVPPRPRPDPPDQIQSSADAVSEQPTEDQEKPAEAPLRGPLLQDPTRGTREF